MSDVQRRAVIKTAGLAVAAMTVANVAPVAFATANPNPERSMSEQHIRFEKKNGLALLTLANPDGNRIGFGVLRGLQAALAEIKKPGTRAVLLRGDGPAFSYGADVKEFGTRPPNELFPLMQEYVDVLGEFERLPMPTMAAVHGVCSSGGLELALAFDLIWAAAGTQIGFLELNIATPPLAGGVQRLASRAGAARAFEAATAGHFYDAAVFERWNVVNRIVPADALASEAEAFALKLASGPTRAFGGTKALLRKWDAEGVAGADKVQIATVAPLLGSKDARAAVTAYMTQGVNRTLPVFTGE